MFGNDLCASWAFWKARVKMILDFSSSCISMAVAFNGSVRLGVESLN